MKLETERLILRPWRETDAESLYGYAKDERVGPAAGWPPHTSVENSREIIRGVLSEPETYAVCRKEDDRAIGSIGLMIGSASGLSLPDNEGELGYWIGVPFWGQGFIPEAVRGLIRYAFEKLRLEKLWCGYFDGNEKSKRVQEQCGFVYHHTRENIPWKSMNTVYTEHVTCLERDRWERERFDIVKISDRKDLTETAARWFSEKWGIPLDAYRESMAASLGAVVPSWYLCLDDGKIVAGMGVIENDFHNRKDLTPNICAVYTEKAYRGRGLAGKLLRFVCDDMHAHGIDTLYLLTDHTGFYERYGWEFYCMAQGDGEDRPSRMYVKSVR